MAQDEVINEKYKYNSPEFEIMKAHLEPALKTDEGAEFMTSTQIMAFFNGCQDQTKYLSSSLLGKSLTSWLCKNEEMGIKYG